MGKVIVSGAGRATIPVTGTPLSAYAEGSIIKINENGSPVEFYVAKHNYETELNGAGRTLVVRKDCYNSQYWNYSIKNTYASSSIDSWLNSTYKNLFSEKILKSIGVTSFQYTPGNGDNTVSMLERAIFLLSGTELGKTENYFNVEGNALTIANTLQIAYLDALPATQWTRLPRTLCTDDAVILSSQGAVSASSLTTNYGSRPCFTLPSTTKIDENGQVIE